MSVSPAKIQPTTRNRTPSVRLWKVFLPVTLGVIGLIAFLVAMIALAYPYEAQQTQQISIISSLMLMCFVIVPMMLCSAIIFLILGAATVGVGALHGITQDKLQQTQELTQKASAKTAETADAASRKSIAFSARFAILDRLTRRQKATLLEESDVKNA